MEKPPVFYYGAQYFRPPNPPHDQHRFHLEKIKHELGFNVVKLFWQWNACQRRPGPYDFSEYDEVMTICDDLGLNVVINTVLEDAPYWLEQAHPECRYVNARGRPDELSGNDNHPSGGHPGLCLDHPVIREEAGKFLTALADCAKRHKSLLGYDCWNEPHIEPNWNTDYYATGADLLYCYCPASIDAFRTWLARKYGTIEALNSAWARYYGDFQEINPPRRHGNFADWLDWWRFWFDNLQTQMQWRYETLKAADPDHFVMSHSGGVPPILARIEAGINNFALAKPVDLWGTSIAPLAQNWTAAETAAVLDLTRSAARGKPFWISELQAGYCHTLGLKKSPRPEPRHIRTWNWLAAAYGAKAIMYWCYLTEVTGNEAQGYGLVRFNGETTDRAREAARNGKLLQRYEHLILSHAPQSDVAILYDPDSSTIMFTQEGNDRWISNSHVAYYRTLWDADLYARWITFEDLCADRIPENVLIAPMHYILTAQAADALRTYVETGGTLIAENSFGLYTPNGMLQGQVPPYGLADVFGLEEEENYYTWPGYESSLNQPFIGRYAEEIYDAPIVRVTDPIHAEFRAHGFLTPLRLTTARAVGEWKDHCLAAHHRFGSGETYYFGTFLGLAMFHNQTQAAVLLGQIIKRKIKPKVQGRNLRPRLIDAGDEAILCVFNNSRSQPFTEPIPIPAKFGRAVDVHHEKEAPIKNSAVELTVWPEDVTVLHLSQGQQSVS